MSETNKTTQHREIHLPLITPPPIPAPEDKALDRVKPPTEKKRSRERER